MTTKLAFNEIPAFFDGNGNPLSGGLLFTYQAGSTTKQTTYQTTGGSAHTNPIVLDSSGRPPAAVWLTSGQTYKFVLSAVGDSDPPSSPLWTIDNVAGINDTSVSFDDWVAGPTPTFVSTTQFTLAGDQTTAAHVGRRVKSTLTAGTGYHTITASSFSVDTTTVTVNGTALDSGLSAISYGLLKASPSALPQGAVTFSQLDLTGPLNEFHGATIGSTSTVNLTTATGNVVDISGTNAITAITLADGLERTVRFTGILTLTNGASLVLPGAANITTAVGDYAVFRGYTAGVVRCTVYSRLDGTAVGSFFKVNSETYDLSTASGTQAVTIGFRPRAVMIFATGAGQPGSTSWGMYDGTTGTAVYDDSVSTAAAYGVTTNIILIETAVGSSQTASIALTSTGFTLTWTKVGTPVGTAHLKVIAFK